MKSIRNFVPWWLVLLEGLAALIIGIYLIAYPIDTAIILVRMLGWYWLFVGIFTIVTILMDRTDWVWRAVNGILGILTGIVVINYPLFSALFIPATLVTIAAILAIGFGVLRLYWALKEGWSSAIAGVLNIILGLLILGHPMLGIITLVYVAAILSIVGGVATIYLAIKMRN
ncbi:MAG: DUF308 domain-containing protein [Methanothrix sp.]